MATPTSTTEATVTYEGVHAKVGSLLARKTFLRGVATSVPVETAERLVADGVGFVRSEAGKVETAVAPVVAEVAADVTNVETAVKDEVTQVESKVAGDAPKADSPPTAPTPPT